MSRHVAPPRARARRRPTRRQTVGIAVVLALGLAAGMAFGTATTAATPTDAARLGVGTGGVGSADPFDLVLVDAAGAAHDAAPGTALPLKLPGADALVPGRTVEATVQVANNHPALSAALIARVGAVPVPGTPDITPHLRVTLLDADGQVLLGGPAGRPQDGGPLGAPAGLAALAARGAPPVTHGSLWIAGADGSATAVTVRVHLLDVPATSALNGGQASLTIRFDATSTETTS
ncbi:hypothetical protein [Cellulomonas hominis]|uniref:hypothetical protein n=1 Tax=Cellulomonas hominis TaxID=156981 RepID=UPI001B97B6D4|nr:hypothetical protein [Cellulomonas hominis]VTR76308.1 hypothetical protein CHMI_01065 [Cellulomonas hominis]